MNGGLRLNSVWPVPTGKTVAPAARAALSKHHARSEVIAKRLHDVISTDPSRMGKPASRYQSPSTPPGS